MVSEAVGMKEQLNHSFLGSVRGAIKRARYVMMGIVIDDDGGGGGDDG